MNPRRRSGRNLDVTDSGSGMLVPVHWGHLLAPSVGELVERGCSRGG